MSIFKTILGGERLRRLDPLQSSVGQDTSMKAELDRMRVSHSGMAFIYSAMDLFVARFGLSDLVIVLKDSHDEIQIFRWGAKSISPERKSLIHAAPGVYSYPALTDNGDRDLMYAACQQVFAELLSRGSASITYDPQSDGEFVAPPNTEGESALETEDPQVVGSRFGVETWRVFASRVLAYVAVANIFLALLNVTGSVRFVLGLVLGLSIPGWSVVGLIHFRDTALEIALSMAASLAIVMVSAQVLITVHFWHLEAYEIFLCLVCLPSLVHQGKWFRTPIGQRR